MNDDLMSPQEFFRLMVGAKCDVNKLLARKENQATDREIIDLWIRNNRQEYINLCEKIDSDLFKAITGRYEKIAK